MRMLEPDHSLSAASAPRNRCGGLCLFSDADDAEHVLQSLFGTLHGIYLGQMIGVDALAAVSIFFPMMFFFLSFILGLGAGSSMLIGQAWGAREVGRAKAIAGTTP